MAFCGATPIYQTKNGQRIGNGSAFLKSIAGASINFSTSTTTGKSWVEWVNNCGIKRTHTASVTDTTPLATQFIGTDVSVSGSGGMNDMGLVNVGDSYDLTLFNDNAFGSGTWTLTAATGVTLDGSAVIQEQEYVTARIQKTAAATVTIFLIHAGTAPHVLQTSAITGTTTVTIAQSGTMFLVSGAGAYTITVPDPTTAAGVYYIFYHSVAITGGDVTITATNGTNKMKGVCISPTAGVTSAGDTNVLIKQGTSTAGDKVSLVSDGVTWSFIAQSRVNAGVVAS